MKNTLATLKKLDELLCDGSIGPSPQLMREDSVKSIMLHATILTQVKQAIIELERHSCVSDSMAEAFNSGDGSYKP